MAIDQGFVDHLLELLDPMPDVSAKRMFGGCGLFREGLMFGLVADSTLYLKVDKENKASFEERGLEPFTYDGKGKPVKMSYHQAPEEALEEVDAMLEWAESAYAAAQRAKVKKMK